MQNIHTYYKQFQHMVQEDLQKGLAPIEKHLKVCLPYLGTTSKVRLASMWTLKDSSPVKNVKELHTQI